MEKEIITLGNTEIEKPKCYHHENRTLLEYADTENIQVSRMIKYFIRYKYDDYIIKSLCIMLPKTSPYVKRMVKLNG